MTAKQYHILASLDWETSERAGAGGMFQVVNLEDQDGNDLTSLVDQGTHYPSLAVLKSDILKALGDGSDVSIEEV
jgi:type I restriction enzyme S subunit